MTSLLWRGVIVWFGILLIAIANGALREAVLIPRIGGGAGHVVSTLLLAAATFVMTAATIGWIAPATRQQAWVIGVFWLGLTLAFEFLAGHVLFGRPWTVLVADYRLDQGRIWPLVLVATLVAPPLAARLRGLL